MNTQILTCSSLFPFVEAAQKEMNTSWPVTVVDRLHHVDPDEMKRVVAAEIGKMPSETDTVLVAMAFCGGVWDHVTFDKKIVIPRCDDCVSILLTTDDQYEPNRKETGHLYLYEEKPEDFSALSLMRDYTAVSSEFKGIDQDMLFRMWFGNYHRMDIIDTGFNDCYQEYYVEAAQNNADQIGAELGYAQGSNRMMEKLVSGNWDEQFLVAEPGHLIRHADFF